MSQTVQVRPQPKPGAVRARKGREPISERTRAERRLAWTLCAPAVLVMLAVTAYPIGYAIYLSLMRYDLRFPERKTFVGLENYVTVLTSSFWWQALWVTLFVTVVSVTVEFVIGMALALLMQRTLIARGLMRTVILIPYGIVTVVAAYSWYYAWTPGTGYLANLLAPGSAPLTQQWPSLAIIILAEIWKTTPFMSLLLLAGLVQIDDAVLRAAKVDGATSWQRFIRVIVPLMKPTIVVALLFRTLDAFRIYDNIYILTNGAHGTASVSILASDNLTIALNLGVGSAIAILILVAVAIIAAIFIKGLGVAAPGQGVK
jgi:trehalose/maltose transport system permease protein